MSGDGRSFRLNGGRFYQQERRIKKRGREYSYSYWYCKSGWGKVSHLGSDLPVEIQQARALLSDAAELLVRLDAVSSVLRRFVRGDVLAAPDLALLAALDIVLSAAVRDVTQRSDLPDRDESAWRQTREIARELLSADDLALFARLGLTRFVSD